MTLQQIRYVVAIEQSGSFTEAAKKMFISQPSISAMVKELEKELGIIIFERSRQGVILTADGKEFLKHAYQMLECENTIVNRFSPGAVKLEHQFSVSSQHYTFVVNAISELEKMLKNTSYNLRLKETLTSTVIEDVAKQRSEVGVIFLSDISEPYIRRLLKANYLDFAPLVEAKTSVFVHGIHPLAARESVTTADLEPFPCIIYDQANDLPLYFSEEVSIPTFRPQKQLYTTDLYTSLVLMKNNNAYNIGSGILMPEINDYRAIPLDGFAPITIGWIGLQNSVLSDIGMEFIRLVSENLEACTVNP